MTSYYQYYNSKQTYIFCSRHKRAKDSISPELQWEIFAQQHTKTYITLPSLKGKPKKNQSYYLDTGQLLGYLGFWKYTFLPGNPKYTHRTSSICIPIATSKHCMRVPHVSVKLYEQWKMPEKKHVQGIRICSKEASGEAGNSENLS